MRTTVRSLACLLAILVAGGAAAQQELVSIAPASGEAGTTLTVTITGSEDVIFTDEASVRFSPATTITHGPVTLDENNVLRTDVSIPSDVAPGIQEVRVVVFEAPIPGVTFEVLPCGGGCDEPKTLTLARQGQRIMMQLFL